VTTSQFQQQVEYQQAVADELEQTIESINGVSSAVVNVVIPQESLFASSSDQPRRLSCLSRSGHNLTAEQVEAIVTLWLRASKGSRPTT